MIKIEVIEDDQISITGDINQLIHVEPNTDYFIGFSDNTKGFIFKRHEKWQISFYSMGNLLKGHKKTLNNAYSDIVEFKGGVDWVEIKNKKYRK